MTTDIDTPVKREPAYKVTVEFGSVEPKTFYKEEGARLVCYGYSIHRDRHGNEIRRTDPEPISSIGYENGAPFTNADRDSLLNAEPQEKRGLLARIFGV